MVNTHPGLLPDTKGYYGEQIQQYVLDNTALRRTNFACRIRRL